MEFKNLTWLAESQYEEIEDGIKLQAPARTDYFVNPLNDEANTSAPFLYQEVSGDFVFKAKVQHDFVSMYDACALMALDNEKLWAKGCFEQSDVGTHAVVSVMTNQKSDDANSVTLEGNEVWLQLARKGNMFAVQYSFDGINFQMARLTYLPMSKTIKVGFVAQSPLGEGGMRYFKHIQLEMKTLDDIRNGNQ